MMVTKNNLNWKRGFSNMKEERFKSFKGKKGNTSKKILRPAKEPEVFKLLRKAKRILALRSMS